MFNNLHHYNHLFPRVWQQLVTSIALNNRIIHETALINLRRIYYISIIAICISLAQLFAFIFEKQEILLTPNMWRCSLIAAHQFVLASMAIAVAYILVARRKTEAGATVIIFQYVFIGVIMVAGVWITAVDQYITENITPFLIVCTIVGVLFLLRPVIACLFYLTTYGVFFYTVGLYQVSAVVVLSNRINGLTICGIGICLSLILWNACRVNILQREKINAQQLQLEASNRQLAELAYFDSLTGLCTRHKWKEHVQCQIEELQGLGRRASIIMMDLDHFKRVNDVYGHLVGDILLQEIAKLIINGIRPVDRVARWGGEEFAMLLPGLSLAAAVKTAEKLRRLIEEQDFSIRENRIRITASFGVVEFTREGNIFEEAYVKADAALYLAKQEGRNRVEYF